MHEDVLERGTPTAIHAAEPLDERFDRCRVREQHIEVDIEARLALIAVKVAPMSFARCSTAARMRASRPRS
jgi:hypothetical protein